MKQLQSHQYGLVTKSKQSSGGYKEVGTEWKTTGKESKNAYEYTIVTTTTPSQVGKMGMRFLPPSSQPNSFPIHSNSPPPGVRVSITLTCRITPNVL